MCSGETENGLLIVAEQRRAVPPCGSRVSHVQLAVFAARAAGLENLVGRRGNGGNRWRSTRGFQLKSRARPRRLRFGLLVVLVLAAMTPFFVLDQGNTQHKDRNPDLAHNGRLML